MKAAILIRNGGFSSRDDENAMEGRPRIVRPSVRLVRFPV